MQRLRWFYGWMGHLPIRWRLALVSFGLLAGLLAALGLLISVTVENALLASQASILNSQASLAIALGGAEKLAANSSSGEKIPPDLATNFVAVTRKVIGLNKNTGVSVVASDGSVVFADNAETGSPVVVLNQATIQQWLAKHPSYMLASDSHGQRELVIL